VKRDLAASVPRRIAVERRAGAVRTAIRELLEHVREVRAEALTKRGRLRVKTCYSTHVAIRLELADDRSNSLRAHTFVRECGCGRYFFTPP
jgi:hypothetical protein